MKKLLSIIGAVIFVAGMSCVSYAQGPGAGAAAPQEKSDKSQSSGPNSDDKDVRDLVHAIMMARLAEQLNLSDEDTVKLVRQFAKHREKLEQNGDERRHAADDLRSAIKDKATDDVIQQKLDKLKTLDGQQIELRREAVKEISTNLSPRQQAQLYLFMNDFESNMRHLLMRAREIGADRLMHPRDGDNTPAPDDRRWFRRGIDGDGQRRPQAPVPEATQPSSPPPASPKQ